MPISEFESVEALRTRLHKIADMIQSHEGALREHAVMLRVIQEDHTALASRVATREQLDNVALATSAQIQSFHTQNTLRLDHVIDRLEPLRRAVYWAATLIVGAVLLALLSGALKSAVPTP